MHLIGCRILLTLCTDFVLFSWESVIVIPYLKQLQSAFLVFPSIIWTPPLVSRGSKPGRNMHQIWQFNGNTHDSSIPVLRLEGGQLHRLFNKHSQSPNNGILKNNCYNTPTSTSQYFLVLGPPEARKPQYEKIFTSRIDNTRKYSQLTKPI